MWYGAESKCFENTLVLAVLTGRQSLKSNHLKPMQWVLKWSGYHKIENQLSYLASELPGIFNSDEISSKWSIFYTHFDPLMSVERPKLFSALRITVVRHNWKRVDLILWKLSENVDFETLCVYLRFQRCFCFEAAITPVVKQLFFLWEPSNARP